MLLCPSEEKGMAEQLAAAKVPCRRVRMAPSKNQPVQGALQALLSKDLELKVNIFPKLLGLGSDIHML